MTSGALFLCLAVLGLVAGDPPSDSALLTAWVAEHHLALTFTNELTAFAAVLLIPAILALYRRLEGSGRPWVAFGCGLLAAAVPVILVVAVVHGRLVYPVYGIDVGEPSAVALMVSLYYGGTHMAGLLMGAALVMLGLAMSGGAMRAFGVVAGVSQIAGAYPWLTGPLPAAAGQAMVAAWLIVAGVQLRSAASPS